MRLPFFAAMIAATATTAVAQNLSYAQDRVSTQSSGFAFQFQAGLGAQSSPLYYGSAESETGISGSFKFGSLNAFGRCFGCDEKSGFGFTGGFNYIGAREESDTFDAIDAAIELGGGIGYTSDDVEASAVIRRGFGGHEGYVLALSADYIMPLSDSVTLRAGPRLLAGDDTFNETYFSNASFTATQGLVSRGVEASVAYDFNETWGVTAKATYDELLEDAADSPISESDDQTSISLILTRNFNW